MTVMTVKMTFAITICCAAWLGVPAVAVAALEFKPNAGKFDVGSNGEVTFKFKANESVVCKSGEGSGEITGNITLKITKYNYFGCQTEKGIKCKTAGAKEEEIVSAPLAGKLIYVDKAKTIAGLAVTSEGAEFTGGPVECKEPCIMGFNMKITGTTIGEVKPMNTKQEVIGFLFAEEVMGFQTWHAVEQNEPPRLELEVAGVGGGPVQLLTLQEMIFEQNTEVKG